MRRMRKCGQFGCAMLLTALLAACGGDSSPTTTVGATLYGPLSGRPMSIQVMAVKSMLEQLQAAGTQIISKQCGTWYGIDSSGSPVYTLDAPIILLVEIYTRDFEKALGAGFIASSDHLKSIQVIDCATIGL